MGLKVIYILVPSSLMSTSLLGFIQEEPIPQAQNKFGTSTAPTGRTPTQTPWPRCTAEGPSLLSSGGLSHTARTVVVWLPLPQQSSSSWESSKTPHNHSSL